MNANSEKNLSKEYDFKEDQIDVVCLDCQPLLHWKDEVHLSPQWFPGFYKC